MTTGALIFAANNGSIDYHALALWNADNIQRHLGIPTHIVTDLDSNHRNNRRHFADIGTVAWFNHNRPDAYDISPWDRTLLVDADYVVATNQLRCLLDADQDFLAHRNAYDITGCNDFQGLNSFGEHRIPMWWATVIMFRRSPHVEKIFQVMRMVRDNWDHYRALYKIRQSVYRNDHALSIALLVCNGHWLDHSAIPWSLATLTPDHCVQQLETDRYRVDFVNGQNQRRWLVINQDYHAMGKSQLEAIVANQG